MFLAGHPSQGCFGLQSHCAPCYFFNKASFYPSDFSFTPQVTVGVNFLPGQLNPPQRIGTLTSTFAGLKEDTCTKDSLAADQR
ncbi:hypothetical protein TNCV_155391 [Trichonephila clavipes]|uniref:Uncharacterized protein n=1 Tax=Trichonephila clavipes TaxID=2585209 RepID=A0A8X6WI52_TRICX|nr:hypothetical protein TNCV_155391 [Trichonephila clavipes]